MDRRQFLASCAAAGVASLIPGKFLEAKPTGMVRSMGAEHMRVFEEGVVKAKAWARVSHWDADLQDWQHMEYLFLAEGEDMLDECIKARDWALRENYSDLIRSVESLAEVAYGLGAK